MDDVLEVLEPDEAELAGEDAVGVEEEGVGDVRGDAVEDAKTDDGDYEYATLRAHYEGEGLSDEELDVIADLAVGCVRQILSFFGEDHVTIEEYEGDDGELILDITGGDLAVLIGRHGRTLDALQMIVASFLSSRLRFYYPLVIDIEGYKSRRRSKLESLARNAASRARRQRGQVALPPMNPYERRLVHLALVDFDNVVTHSEGEEPYRRVMVTYVRD